MLTKTKISYTNERLFFFFESLNYFRKWNEIFFKRFQMKFYQIKMRLYAVMKQKLWLSTSRKKSESPVIFFWNKSYFLELWYFCLQTRVYKTVKLIYLLHITFFSNIILYDIFVCINNCLTHPLTHCVFSYK